MKRRLIIVFGVLLIIVVLGFLMKQRMTVPTAVLPDVQMPTVTPTPVIPVATLEVYTPPVWVVSPGNTDLVEASSGQKILSGTKIRTGDGGRVQIIYENKSVTRLDGNSEVTLTTLTANPQTVVITLEKNRIWSRISKLLGRESYQSETNTLVASVRGTSYGHGIQPDGSNKITTTEGVIDNGCVNQSQTATVSAEFKAIFMCKSGVVVRPGRIDARDKDEWFLFNREEDKKLDALYGVEVYSGQVLGDAIVRPSLTPTITPTGILVDCVGADGKTSRVTREVCDRVSSFWRSQTPTVTPHTSNTSTTSTPTSTPTPVVVTSTPSITSVPISITDLTITCSRISCSGNIFGSGFDSLTRVETVGPLTVDGVVSPVSSSEVSVTFTNLIPGSYQVKATNSTGQSTTSAISFSVI